MKIFKGCLLALAFGVAIPSVGSAQEASSHPRILQITREFTKPGKAGTVHDKAESAFVQAMAKAKWPTHYLGMTSLSGKQRALFFTWYESFEAWEKDTAATGKNATLSADLERASEADGGLLDSMDQAVFLFNEEESLRPKGSGGIGHMRYLEVLVFHLKPGHYKEWDDLTKLVKAAYEKADPEAHWGEYDLMYGGAGDTHLVLTSRATLADIDKAMMGESKFMAALGEDGMKKFSELSASAIESSESQLFAFNPRMSYAPDEWIKSDGDFWKPKPMMRAPKATTEEKKPTP